MMTTHGTVRGLTIELAPQGASFEVSPEKLIGLLAQMSDDAARRKALYDAERQQLHVKLMAKPGHPAGAVWLETRD